MLEAVSSNRAAGGPVACTADFVSSNLSRSCLVRSSIETPLILAVGSLVNDASVNTSLLKFSKPKLTLASSTYSAHLLNAFSSKTGLHKLPGCFARLVLLSQANPLSARRLAAVSSLATCFIRTTTPLRFTDSASTLSACLCFLARSEATPAIFSRRLAN